MMLRVLLACVLGLSFSVAQAAETTKNEKTQKAIFAGGCFWCMEADFEGTPGIISVTSGYAGGTMPNPTYQQVSSGRSGYVEAVQVVYDPSQVTYSQLLTIYWDNIDPVDKDGQFVDRGNQYHSVIFYGSEDEKSLALASRKARMERLGLNTLATKVVAASTFYPAEEYHQDYATKNPLHYKAYKYSSGRDKRLKELWNK